MRDQLMLDEVLPTRVRVRYRSRVTVEPRCCNCGTRWSFAWRGHEHRGESYPVCGDCSGLTFEQVWGPR